VLEARLTFSNILSSFDPPAFWPLRLTPASAFPFAAIRGLLRQWLSVGEAPR
jgi:hypothetical protein